MFTHHNNAIGIVIFVCALTLCSTALAYDAWPSDFEWISPQVIDANTQEIAYKYTLHLNPTYHYVARYGEHFYLSKDQVFDDGDFWLADPASVLLPGSPCWATVWLPPGASEVTISTRPREGTAGGKRFARLPRTGTYYIFLKICRGADAPEDTDPSNDAVMAPNPIQVVGPPTTFYVDDDAAGSNDGSCWADAYPHLQDALAEALAGDAIRVAQGTYKPDRSSQYPTGTGDRAATFQLKNGIAVTGGYAGVNEPDPNARDVETYRTLLSGDLSGNDVGGLADPSRAENCYHVVTGSGTNETAMLDGFTISGGNADDLPGGGMLNQGGRPTLARCTFVGNAARAGGGMHNSDGGAPNLSHCRFSANSAKEGGGMSNDASEPNLTNCIFSGNLAEKGGGMHNAAMSSPVLTNCTFSGNSAVARGGATCNQSISSIALLNCILWHNTPDQISCDAASQTAVAYSDVQDGFPGESNIDVDPLFATPDYWDPNGTPHDPNDDFWVAGDYHLKSEAGRWDPNAGAWVTDDVTSPCIDAGDPDDSVGSELTPNGGCVNMGAYGGTAEASKSPSTPGGVESFETGDFDAFPWAFYGAAFWTATSETNHSGTYSARAGAIGGGESSTLSLTIDCVGGDMSFWCRVSSESGYDSLQFYIDGLQQGQWSGELDWTEVSFPVTAGTRTFEWTYSKDGSVSRGDDTAWIDDIALPD